MWTDQFYSGPLIFLISGASKFDSCVTQINILLPQIYLKPTVVSQTTTTQQTSILGVVNL